MCNKGVKKIQRDWFYFGILVKGESGDNSAIGVAH